MSNDEQLRYPIGKFQPKEAYANDEIKDYIGRIEALPSRIEKAVSQLTIRQLDTPYREGGWTARQVLHHLSDSHLNAYIRAKWTLTEDSPTIKAYDEKAWAETPEVVMDPMISVSLLKALHHKWVSLLTLIDVVDLKRSFFHPESKLHITLGRQIATYAWHGEHHLGHINIVAAKKQ